MKVPYGLSPAMRRGIEVHYYLELMYEGQGLLNDLTDLFPEIKGWQAWLQSSESARARHRVAARLYDALSLRGPLGGAVSDFAIGQIHED